MTPGQLKKQEEIINTKSYDDIQKYKITISTSSASRDAKNHLYSLCDLREAELSPSNLESAMAEHGDLDDID